MVTIIVGVPFSIYRVLYRGPCYKSSWAPPATKKVNRVSEHSTSVLPRAAVSVSAVGIYIGKVLTKVSLFFDDF